MRITAGNSRAAGWKKGHSACPAACMASGLATGPQTQLQRQRQGGDIRKCLQTTSSNDYVQKVTTLPEITCAGAQAHAAEFRKHQGHPRCTDQAATVVKLAGAHPPRTALGSPAASQEKSAGADHANGLRTGQTQCCSSSSSHDIDMFETFDLHETETRTSNPGGKRVFVAGGSGFF